VSFDVGAQAYDRFMGRFSQPLAAKFMALIGRGSDGGTEEESASDVGAGGRDAGCSDAGIGRRALDVGCGPGALTAKLIERFGASAVSAIDPSETFVAALRARQPGVDIRRGFAEALPFADDTFDLAMAQLVVHFMRDPAVGLSEMVRVTRPNGVVAACVWDHAGGGGPLSLFWQAVQDLDPDAPDESGLAGAREGQLVKIFERAGLRLVEPATLTVRVSFTTFDDWWQPYTLGVGPAGGYVAGLDPARREELRARCAELLPPAPFDIQAVAWTALGRV
jgi:SAM-dependent methyltransferase